MKKIFLFPAFFFLMIISSNAQSVDQKQTVSPAIGAPSIQVSNPVQTVGGTVAQVAPTLDAPLPASEGNQHQAMPVNEEKKSVSPSIPGKKDE